MAIEGVLKRRRTQREALLERARGFAKNLAGRVELRAAVMIGSVARGDFNRWSDVDVRLIADGLPDRVLERLAAVDPRPPSVQPVPWTPFEWRRELARRNPMAVEALERGVWLRGSPGELEGETSRPGSGR